MWGSYIFIVDPSKREYVYDRKQESYALQGCILEMHSAPTNIIQITCFSMIEKLLSKTVLDKFLTLSRRVTVTAVFWIQSLLPQTP